MNVNTTPYNPAVDPDNPFGYLPNRDLTIASTAVYGVVTILLTIFSLKHRTWYFLVMTISGIAEVVGYAYRWSLAKNPDQRTPYIIMYCCIVLAPVGLALADYLLVGRLIRLVGRQYSIVNPKFVEFGFIISDILSIGVQSAGAGLITSGSLSNIPLGSNVLIGGLGINLVSFCFFGFVTLHLHWSIYRGKADFTGQERWVKIFYALYLSMILLIIRSIYRIVEFSTGFRGYLAIHEVYFYVFECLLIVFAFGLFVPLHPGFWMPREDTESLIKKSRKI
ncbi:unnamed protein product [Rotaria magnacalcarata]|uniref:RTA1-domain-containing protein n=1 Tax=Rotaria magnacalcarata TaxID=392030 RepID=A0A816WUZ7_9BILA|nr:unnamed protein product [Rotaria magnacalcarata]CAF4081194.1 unnamed protein product [Rotaria magnacalcarata]